MVEVMRSCSAPISVGQRRLVAHGGRHTAEQRGHLGARLGEAEDVVDEQQHVLILARRGSTPPWSGRSAQRAYALRAARSSGRKTRAVLSITPDSCISLYRSLPSRVRSPTPANTEIPPCCLAMLLISSMMMTVLPTPAPPNRPILPPLAYGRDQVDDLDAGLEDLGRGLLLLIGRRRTMDRPALLALDRRLVVHRLAEQVEDTCRGSCRRPAP